MNCRYQSTFLQDNYIYTIVCDHPIEGFGVIILRQNLNIINELSQSFFSYCYQHSNSDFCISRQNMSLWLENNYPPIENFSDANGGVCVCVEHTKADDVVVEGGESRAHVQFLSQA